MIKHVFIDFNGTLLDDVDLCLDLLNRMLKDQNKELVDIKKYKEIFKFPVKDYYVDAGIDFNIEPFESLAKKFMDEYVIEYKKCKLYDGIIDTLDFLKSEGINLYILSASKQSILDEQCRYFNLSRHFDKIIGIKTIYANSKEDVAIEFIDSSNIDKQEAIFIGDTLHDYEVAKAVGINCILVESGHQSHNVLKAANTTILKDLNELKENFDEIFN
jgi:phosphoglycolate phosphatase